MTTQRGTPIHGMHRRDVAQPIDHRLSFINALHRLLPILRRSEQHIKHLAPPHRSLYLSPP